MTKFDQDVKVAPGEDKTLRFDVQDREGGLDLTTATALEWRLYTEPTTTVNATAPSALVVEVPLSGSVTAAMDDDLFVHELWATVGGQTTRLARGQFYVEAAP